MTHQYIFSALTGVILLASCSMERPPQMDAGTDLPDIYPDYIGVTIPAGIAPMNFNMADESEIDRIYVSVTGSNGGSIESSGKWADFDIDKWHKLTEMNSGGTLTFDVSVKDNSGKWKRFKPFEMYVSEHSLDDYGITYRKIAPGFETFSKIGIYQRCLADFEETPILEETAVNGQCLNCHYANRGNPDQFSMHIRGANGGTIIHTAQGTEYLNTRTPETVGSCTYGYWHPDGRYCAFSLNRIYQNFYENNHDLIEPWDAHSDVAVLDTSTGQLILSPLTTTDDCETTPAFSADGKTIYYCYAHKVKMPAEYNKLKYGLRSIGFDPESGTFADSINTIIVADSIGKSVSLPRPSYDGKYIMYCLSDYGTTPVNRSNADLWIMDLTSGETRPMDEVNSNDSDAYHNWSSGSRWFLFGSKRGDGLYARVYLSCMDDDGTATKPFILPQRNPKAYYHKSLHSYNAPDFTTVKVDLDPRKTHDMVMSGDTKQVTVRKD